MTTFGNRTMERAPGECLQCGTKLSSLFPTCLWCSSSSQPNQRASISNPDLALQGGLLDGPRNTELSLVNPLSPPQPSTSKSLRRVASQQPTPHLSFDLKDESLMDALSSTFPSFLNQEKGEKQVKHIQPDRDASMRPMEGSDVAMLRPSIPSFEAGSSPSSSTSTPHLQSRSRSLFALTSSRPSEEAMTTTSTTSSIMTVARSITRRLSSSTSLRAQPMVDRGVVEGKKSLHDQEHDDVFEGSGHTLSRKKRLQSPVVIHPPAPIGSTLSKKVSRTSLSSPPIAISLRPGTADSSTSSRRDPSPGGEERGATPKVAPVDSVPLSTSAPAPETRGVRWSLEDEHPTPKLKSNGPAALKLVGADETLSRTTSRSPTNSVTSSTQSIPRLGHPSRPYYSAIRKHCMSSPAASSRPSTDQSLAPPLPAKRPTSTSVPPSAFTMTSLTPFTRRPVSIGTLPASAPATGSSSRPGSAGNGMSAFDISDDALEEVEEPKPRKSSSLSRAFGRRSSQEPGKKRRMSATLFSEGGSKDFGKRQSDVADATHVFRALNMGISMSGETEMRMALAAMQQQEEQTASEHVEGGSSANHTQGQTETSSQKKYRFRQTMDLSGAGASSAVASPVTENGVEGKPKKKAQDSTVLKKLKRGLKGLLK